MTNIFNKSYIRLLLIFGLSTTTSAAQEVGIQFDNIKIGTKLTITTASFPQETYVEEYIGQEDGYFLIQNHVLLEDGSTEPRNKNGFDAKGRQVFSIVDGKKNTYTPYSCHYVVGKCTHTHKYFNRFTKKFVSNVGKFNNRLEGKRLYVGVITFDNSMYEVPFDLGPNNLRLSSEYKNALGKPAGHKFVDLQIP